MKKIIFSVLIYGSVSAQIPENMPDMGQQSEENIPYNIGSDDTSSSNPGEVYDVNNPYMPQPGSWNTNEGYDEYNPSYNQPRGNSPD